MFASIITPNHESKVAYKPLGPVSEEFDIRGNKKKGDLAFIARCVIALVCCSVLQISLAAYGLYILRASSTPDYNKSASQVSNCSCGTTIQQAKNLGCEFDVLSLSWLPPPCRDVALTREFASSGPGAEGKWDYWADVNGTVSLTLDEVAALAEQPNGVVYTSLGFHVLHCSFYWRKQWRVTNGIGALAMEARYSPQSHVKHCEHVFMLEGSRDKGMTEGLVRLGGGFF